ncbi:MAG: FAD-dependent oxidoreductase [Planctomycetota bacterium]
MHTSDGFFECPNVVLATGSWTANILATLGVELPLKVARTEEAWLRMPQVDVVEDEFNMAAAESELETRFRPDPLEMMPVPHPVILDLTRKFRAHCEPHGGRTRIGRLGLKAFEEVQGVEGLPKTASKEFETWARSALSERMPVYSDMDAMGSQATYTTVTSDNRPIVGRVGGIGGLYVVAGFSGSDFHLAPSIGEGIAQMIAGAPVTAFDPEFLSPERF